VSAGNFVLDDDAPASHPDLTPGNYVVIAVADNGHGMASDIASKAFDPFFTTKGSRGTGLGLSMVYGFVKQSGGNTIIESRPGAGTIVKLYLPRAKQLAEPTHVTAAEGPRTPRNELILVVEDNDELRGIAAHHIRSLGYRVVGATDGAVALSLIEAALKAGAPFDLLFTDVVMPSGIDGAKLAREAQKLQPTLPVLFTSGFTPATLSAAAQGDLLPKPYSKEELGARIRTAIEAAARAAPIISARNKR
jgi:CheY-like chemotaxis protein